MGTFEINILSAGSIRLAIPLLFDALHLSAQPLATVEITHRGPSGFHANEIAAR
ncbi:hypothetical protein [Paraburkholderia sp. BL17N1]|uniref:hypothetical protein n=1 Tax=Paraburkholderia sp. BL17N1 TaxID=1938798 RepID=UPI0013157311|nr:hypothetical protein [Paraburkholderia sp. BL17N1]